MRIPECPLRDVSVLMVGAVRWPRAAPTGEKCVSTNCRDSLLEVSRMRVVAMHLELLVSRCAESP
jgi:hypothetical protein